MGVMEGESERFSDKRLFYLTLINIAIGIGIVGFIVLGLYQSFAFHFYRF